MIKQYNYPTILLFGEGSTKELAKRIKDQKLQCCLLVSDPTLTKLGLTQKIESELKSVGLNVCVFDQVHPNPIEEDVENGTKAYLKGNCDSIVALGGGSPMDAAKTILISASQKPPLSQYDDAIGGDAKIVLPLPPLFAIPTTAGTGSEVGRCSVIVMRETNNKTIFFHPHLLPKIAALDPTLTLGLPASVTAATGIDAFTHSLEAFFAPGFDPMADGIALESIRLIVKHLPVAVKEGSNLEARSAMLLASTMGATAFQKGLGMIHSLAHPLSSECGLHHGLSNALMLPASVQYLEQSKLNEDQKDRLARVQRIFDDEGLKKSTLSQTCYDFISSLGIKMGLSNHGVEKDKFDLLAKKAFADVCHKTNMIPVNIETLRKTLEASF